MEAGGDGRARLRSLKHIVVVMMENRSFDHMLGYLSMEGMDEIDGLQGDEFNLHPDGTPVPVHAFDAEKSNVQRVGEALRKGLDPDHSPKGVKIQLGPGPGVGATGTNGGFVESFVKSRKSKADADGDLRGVPMGHYTSKDVPVYDHLARQYCVCDRWYCSIPGDTWPNRLYSLAGQDGPNVTESSGLLDKLSDLPAFRKLKSLPVFDVPAFTRQLKDKQWRWYSHDPATLRAADSKYRDLGEPMRDNFAFFDRRKVDWVTELIEKPIVRGGSFLDHAARGELPQVSWIDPNFVDLSVREAVSNDDHPPSDIRAGQAFVFDVYEALLNSPNWDDTLLVVTYDEHGGFYDHRMPPPVPKGDKSGFKNYGVRVPALFVGPRVRREVLHEPPRIEGRDDRDQPQFDHTTLIKTILLAFARNPDAAIEAMPERVRRSPDLGQLLLDEPRTDIDPPRNTRDLMDTWRAEARRRRTALPIGDSALAENIKGTRSRAPDGAGHPVVLTDFQVAQQALATAMRRCEIDV